MPFRKAGEASDLISYRLDELQEPAKRFAAEYGISVAQLSWISLAHYLRGQARRRGDRTWDGDIKAAIDQAQAYLTSPQLQALFKAVEDG